MKEIDKIAFINVVNGKTLSTRSKGKEKFYIPGGKREGNETDEETLVREIKEELNVDIIPTSITYFGTFIAQSDGDKTGILVKMTCYKAEYSGNPEPTSEIAEIKWLNSNDLEIISEVDKKIFKDLKDKGELT